MPESICTRKQHNHRHHNPKCHPSSFHAKSPDDLTKISGQCDCWADAAESIRREICAVERFRYYLGVLHCGLYRDYSEKDIVKSNRVCGKTAEPRYEKGLGDSLPELFFQ
jgi:hypothetical protein